MWVSELWRYPVKSMAGEPLHHAELRQDGIAGDRLLPLRDAHGRVVTARSRPRLLGLHAVLGPDGEPLIEDRPWTDPWVAGAVEAAAGTGARLVRSAGLQRLQRLPVPGPSPGSPARSRQRPGRERAWCARKASSASTSFPSWSPPTARWPRSVTIAAGWGRNSPSGGSRWGRGRP